MANLKDEIGLKLLPFFATIAEKLITLWDKPETQGAINRLLGWIEKIVGDEESGLTGIVTYLMSGDVKKAFDIAFGPESYEAVSSMFADIQTFAENLTTAFNNLSTAWNAFYGGFASLNNRVTLWINETQTKIFNILDALNVPNKGAKPWPYMTPAGGWGFQHGGSFTVPGFGSGDRPYMVGLEPGERVTVTPRNRVGPVAAGGRVLSLTVNINTPVNLADRAFAERELLPYIEAGVRQIMARTA
jgi:hypothetical protein